MKLSDLRPCQISNNTLSIEVDGEECWIFRTPEGVYFTVAPVWSEQRDQPTGMWYVHERPHPPHKGWTLRPPVDELTVACMLHSAVPVKSRDFLATAAKQVIA